MVIGTVDATLDRPIIGDAASTFARAELS